MRRLIALGMLAVLLGAGCKVYLWAGRHELELPPGEKPTPERATTAAPTPEARY